MNFDIRPESIVLFPVLLFSIICHEVGHAYAAYRGGDDTARLQGRITLNPLAHIDPIGTVIIPILQLISSIPLIGWAKPVPVNPLRLRTSRWNLVVSLAGVTMNLLLAIFAAVALKILLMTPFRESLFQGDTTSMPNLIFEALLGMFQINISLLLFNLIPIPPLDGSHVFFHFITTRDTIAFKVFEFLERFGFVILIILFYSGAIGFLLKPAFLLVHLLLTVFLNM